MEKAARFCHHCGWDSKLAAAGRGAAAANQRPAWKRWVAGVSLSVAGLLVLLLMLIPRSGAETVLQVGQPAPDFTLTTLEGERITLSELKGKAVVVNFWASWCKPCREEMPHFQMVYDQYRDQGLELLGINVGDAKPTVTDFVDRVGVRFPILIDVDESAQTAYKILPLPATFFIDREGIIRGVYQFQMSLPQIEDEVKRLLVR
ncbi:MAG: redoxin domain-containing protein [Bacillota bacterium]